MSVSALISKRAELSANPLHVVPGWRASCRHSQIGQAYLSTALRGRIGSQDDAQVFATDFTRRWIGGTVTYGIQVASDHDGEYFLRLFQEDCAAIGQIFAVEGQYAVVTTICQHTLGAEHKYSGIG